MGIYRVTPLQEGDLFSTKQMEATEGRLLPRHRATVESVIVVIEGGCVVRFSDSEHALKVGESLVIPAGEWHQIAADPDFQAIHIMPKEIRFEFSD